MNACIHWHWFTLYVLSFTYWQWSWRNTACKGSAPSENITIQSFSLLSPSTWGKAAVIRNNKLNGLSPKMLNKLKVHTVCPVWVLWPQGVQNSYTDTSIPSPIFKTAYPREICGENAQEEHLMTCYLLEFPQKWGLPEWDKSDSISALAGSWPMVRKGSILYQKGQH